jgi:hypothetical protein
MGLNKRMQRDLRKRASPARLAPDARRYMPFAGDRWLWQDIGNLEA